MNRGKEVRTMSDNKNDKTKDTEIDSKTEQENTKVDQSNNKSDQSVAKDEKSNGKNDQPNAKDEQSNSKDDQPNAKDDKAEVGSQNTLANGSGSNTGSAGETIPLGNNGSNAMPISNGSTGQTLTANKEATNMADKIITKDSNGNFDYSNSKAYLTVKGDTLFGVAQDHNVVMEQLRYFNGLEKGTNKLPVGITLHIPNGYVDVPVGK